MLQHTGRFWLSSC